MGISRSISLQVRPLAGGLVLWLVTLSTPHAQQHTPVSVVVARQSEITERIPVVGSLAAREEIQVHSLIEGQVIEAILVESGQHVAKGQALAVLETTEARMLLGKNSVRLLRAKAAVSVEESRVSLAGVTEAETRKILERSRALQPKGVVSQQLLEEHHNAHARALAELELARQSLALAHADAEIVARERKEIELTIERSTVRAPEAGLILRRSARIGAMTSASANPLFVIAKDAVVEFVAQVTETSLVRLREGMRVDISLPGDEVPVAGTLRLNAAELDPTTRSGEVRITVDADENLKPGVFARGSINTSTRRNILLPGSAVKTAAGSTIVFVVEDGVVEMRDVAVGARQDGLVEIVGGINDGDMVVLKATGFIKAADKVLPLIAGLETLEHGQSASLPPSEITGAVR